LGEDLPLKRDDAAKEATQKRRMARYERVRLLHEQGYSLAQIAATGIYWRINDCGKLCDPTPTTDWGTVNDRPGNANQANAFKSRRRIPTRDHLVVLLVHGEAHPKTIPTTPDLA
jgi:hypothetical protein